MPPSFVDYYAVLGINRGATNDEIKSAYKRKARATHPDMNPGDADAERKFRQVVEAWNVLKDKGVREVYDVKGPEAPEVEEVRSQDFDLGDIGDLFDHFQSILS